MSERPSSVTMHTREPTSAETAESIDEDVAMDDGAAAVAPALPACATAEELISRGTRGGRRLI